MKYDKIYFNLYSNLGTVTTTGINFNLNMKYLLGELFDQYRAFSIKLEGFRSGITNTAVIADDYLLLHMKGLEFFNGYDSSILNNDSRVIELLDCANAAGGYGFMSNTNAINFTRPSTHNVTLSLFFTRITSDDPIIVNPEGISYIFSITGIETYKINNIKLITTIPRIQLINSINFTLNAKDAITSGTRGQTYTFTNINLYALIGSDFLRRYKRFNLITKYIGYIDAIAGYLPAGNVNSVGNIIMSGLNWVKPSIINNNLLTSAHTDTIAIIGQTKYNNNNISFQETYIENPFNFTNGNVTLSISHTSILNVNYIPINGVAAGAVFPRILVNFDIIPIN